MSPPKGAQLKMQDVWYKVSDIKKICFYCFEPCVRNPVPCTVLHTYLMPIQYVTLKINDI
jgi:hypothetical protein